MSRTLSFAVLTPCALKVRQFIHVAGVVDTVKPAGDSLPEYAKPKHGGWVAVAADQFQAAGPA